MFIKRTHNYNVFGRWKFLLVAELLVASQEAPSSVELISIGEEKTKNTRL
jgi:hypothetical protein